MKTLLAQLKADIAADHPAPGFGSRVGQLRNTLSKAGEEGLDTDEVAAARSFLAELDKRYFAAFASRIRAALNSPDARQKLADDLARLRRFIDGTRRVWKYDESAALQDALSLASELAGLGFELPSSIPAKAPKPPRLKGGATPIRRGYVHHPTLDDDYDYEPRVLLVSGGAFESNRRHH